MALCGYPTLFACGETLVWEVQVRQLPTRLADIPVWAVKVRPFDPTSSLIKFEAATQAYQRRPDRADLPRVVGVT